VVRKLPVLVAIAVAVSFGVAACGSDDSSTTSAGAATTSSTESSTESSTTASGGGGGETVDLTETEYKIDPADPTIKAGSVTFSIKNAGSQAHDVQIEGNGVEETSDTLAPGSSGELTVDLQPGSYEMYCTIDGHRDLGMEGTVTVQ
jgi:uncharacterized cupredoxin-like copper-binding protein